VKLVYLDHQILIDEANWPRLKALFDRGVARLAFGSWNAREIVQANLRRQERMEFVQSLSPLFMQDMIVLQRRELRAFLNLHFFGRGIFPFSAFSQSFSSFLWESFAIPASPNYSLVEYATRQGAVAGDVVEEGKEAHMEAAGAIAQSRGAWRAFEDQIMHSTILSLIPSRGADGALADLEQLERILRFCLENRNLLLRSCPAICVEGALADARAIDPNRRPKPSDTADLFHGVSGLSYSDFFVSADRWAMGCAQRAKEASARLGVETATLLGSVDDLERAFEGM
jgi:hypothetical protein